MNPHPTNPGAAFMPTSSERTIKHVATPHNKKPGLSRVLHSLHQRIKPLHTVSDYVSLYRQLAQSMSVLPSKPGKNRLPANRKYGLTRWQYKVPLTPPESTTGYTRTT